MAAEADASGPNVAGLVHVRVVEAPDACAVVDAVSGAGLSYAQLWERAGRLAQRLVAAGVTAGAPVAVDIARSAELFVALLGIVRAGAVYLPLDAHAPADRVAGMLADAGCRWSVGGNAAGTTRIPLDPADAGAVPDRSWWITVGPDSPAYIAYTSGSTGRPKGVVVPHRAVRRLVTAQDYCAPGPGDRVACSSNPAFDATTFEVWTTLTSGATAVVMPTVTDLDLDAWIALVRAQRISTMFLTTSLFHMVASERPEAFRTVRDLLVGGEQLRIDLARAVLDGQPPARLLNVYGPTETTTFASWYPCTPGSLAGRARVPVGYPLNHTSLHVVDEALRPVPDGEVGELCIGGPGVASGYLRRPDLTAQRFVGEPGTATPMYRTGDLARRDPDGCVELHGRTDRQVKLRGFRIELEEIENALLGTRRVGAAFVERVGEGPAAMLVAFVVAHREGSLDTRALAAEVCAALPEYMVPSRFVRLDRVPIGPTGKVDRDALLARLEQPDHPDTPAAATLAGQIGEICREVLGAGPVGPADNFLDLGGNSITAIQLASRLRQRLRLDVEPADVLLAESLADLAGQRQSGGN